MKLLFVLLFSVSGSYAQSLVSEIPLDLGSSPEQILFTDHKNTNTKLLSVADNKAVHYLLLDNDYKLKDEFSEKKQWAVKPNLYTKSFEKTVKERSILFGKLFTNINSISINGSKYLNVFLRDDRNGLYFQKVSFDDDKATYLFSWLPGRKEDFIGCFKTGNLFFWITYTAPDHLYKLYKIDEDIKISERDLTELTPVLQKK